MGRHQPCVLSPCLRQSWPRVSLQHHTTANSQHTHHQTEAGNSCLQIHDSKAMARLSWGPGPPTVASCNIQEDCGSQVGIVRGHWQAEPVRVEVSNGNVAQATTNFVSQLATAAVPHSFVGYSCPGQDTHGLVLVPAVMITSPACRPCSSALTWVRHPKAQPP